VIETNVSIGRLAGIARRAHQRGAWSSPTRPSSPVPSSVNMNFGWSTGPHERNGPPRRTAEHGAAEPSSRTTVMAKVSPLAAWNPLQHIPRGTIHLLVKLEVSNSARRIRRRLRHQSRGMEMTLQAHTGPSIVGLTVTAYWLYVARWYSASAGTPATVRKVLVPAQRRERVMVGIGCRSSSAGSAFRWRSPSVSAVDSPDCCCRRRRPPHHVLVIRFIVAGVALGCLALSIVTWRYMGEQWRMGIDPTQKLRLLVDGPFAKVRHPDLLAEHPAHAVLRRYPALPDDVPAGGDPYQR